MSVSLKIIIRGNTIRVDATITEYDGSTALDPDSHSIQLYTGVGDTSGAAETSPTYVAAGSYTQKFVIPADGVPGRWKVRWEETTGGEKGSNDIYFDVKK